LLKQKKQREGLAGVLKRPQTTAKIRRIVKKRKKTQTRSNWNKKKRSVGDRSKQETRSNRNKENTKKMYEEEGKAQAFLLYSPGGRKRSVSAGSATP